jgi:ligand-binding sensor domain-containing protein
VQEVRRLPDGRFAIGSLLGGVLLLRADGTLERAIDTAAGLSDNFVFGLAVDPEGLLWLGQNHGVSTLEIASPLSVFDARSGLEGSVQAIHRHRGDLWVGTSSGVFTTARASRRAGDKPFRPLPEIRDGGWSFASAGDDLVIASAFGASVLRQGRLFEIAGTSDWTVYSMATSERDPDRVWLGFSSGLGAARRTLGGWVFEGRVADFEEEVRSIVELPDGTLWVSNGVAGVTRFEFRPSN